MSLHTNGHAPLTVCLEWDRTNLSHVIPLIVCMEQGRTHLSLAIPLIVCLEWDKNVCCRSSLFTWKEVG